MSGNATSRILIADDQQDVLEALRLLLKNNRYSVETVTSPAGLLDAAEHSEFDLILMDLNYARDTTSGQEGIDVLQHLNSVENVPPIVVMTGWASIALAVEVMQKGVGDFVEKPWSNARLLEVVSRQIALGAQRRELRSQAAETNRAHDRAEAQLRRQNEELAEALAIQRRLLPEHIPEMQGYELAAGWQPARVVAGDYFDLLPFGNDSLGLCIGDVAGKGLPAALLMANLQAAVRGLAAPSMPPDRLCSQLNSLLVHNTGADRFVSFFYAQLEREARRLRYCNAGHNHPILQRRDGSRERLENGGGVLGVFANSGFECGVADLRPGDRVVLFTDGITEAHDVSFDEFGESRLIEILSRNLASSAAQLHAEIMAATAGFNSGEWEDDATLVILAVK